MKTTRLLLLAAAIATTAAAQPNPDQTLHRIVTWDPPRHAPAQPLLRSPWFWFFNFNFAAL